MTEQQAEFIKRSFQKYDLQNNSLLMKIVQEPNKFEYEMVVRSMRYIISNDLHKRSGVPLEQLVKNVWTWLQYE